MAFLSGSLSLLLIALVLWDGFESMVLPRRVMRPYRFARFYYYHSWRLWRRLALQIPPGHFRETFLSIFGPLSLIGLFATWVVGLVVGFGWLHWSLGSPLHPPGDSFTGYLYLSGTTFFTLGYGDVTPTGGLGRFLTVVEAGLGFAFLACVIGYLPVLYQAFSKRELTISLLDARGGSPPSAAQVLFRLAEARQLDALTPFLIEWERWAAELLESHLSYPVLSYYRSQHDNQSWLTALTAMLDTCALVIAGAENVDAYQAQLSFAMARHAAVDLSLVFQMRPPQEPEDRLPGERLDKVRQYLGTAGLALCQSDASAARLTELRGMYEPFVIAMSRHFLLGLPEFLPEKVPVDNWQTSPWVKRTPGIGKLGTTADEHFG